MGRVTHRPKGDHVNPARVAPTLTEADSMTMIAPSRADRLQALVERTRAKAKASAWLTAEKTEIERAKADLEARVTPRAATLPRPAALDGPALPIVGAPSFEARQLQNGKEFCAAVMLPDGRDLRIGAFKTEAEAQAWIDAKSASWLATQ
jgi:hypothetical protein